MGRAAGFGYGAVGLGMAHGLLASSAPGEVTIDRRPEVVERRTFDPAHLPAAMPSLGPHEAAVTQSQYDCSLKLGYEIEEHKSDAGRCTAILHIQSVTATLHLKIIVWLPRGAPTQLVAHEEGHRQIDQRMHQEAAEVARTMAQKLDGRELSGQADDCAAAGQKAANSAANQFCREYLDRVAGRASQINEAYDQLTAHGTKSEPTPDEAIRQAFAKNKQATDSRTATHK